MESFEKRQQVDMARNVAETENAAGKKDVVENFYSDALKSESFEETVEAVEKLEDLQNFRLRTAGLSFGSFWETVETVSNLNKAEIPQEEKTDQINKAVEVLSERASRFSSRIADLYQALLAEALGQVYEPHFEEVAEKIVDLKKITGSKRSDIDVLFSGDITWDKKSDCIESQLVKILEGFRARDKREGKEMEDDVRRWREEQLKKAPKNPSERRNESQPGVDAMERLKEGERAPAIWTIDPAWGGYYKEQSFSQWDNKRNVWHESKYTYSDAEIVPLSDNTDHKKGPIDIKMNANVFVGQWVSLPIPYTHSLHKIEAGGRNCQVQQDQNGDLVVLVENGQGEAVGIDVFLAPNPNKKFRAKESKEIEVPNMPCELSEETEKKIEEIKKTKRGNIERAKAIKRYVVQRIQYLAPKDQAEAENYNSLYRTNLKGFVGAVDEVKKGDCDVVNTYFAGLCSKIGISVRHCIGHNVKGKDEEGMANINSGTGHGWSEVWDEVRKEWTRMDATPAGDPNLEEQEEQKSKDSAVPGDYGGQEAVAPTDEQLDKLRKKLLEHKERLSYTKEERQLAEATGVELKEARQIVKEINQAEQTRLPDGERVVDALTRLFNAIIESRKTTVLAYEGPVRKREGGEQIEDIVRHKIGVMAGDSDPLSRAKSEEKTKEEENIGGFDVYIIGDKSGSMGSEVEGEALWQIQRRAEYLIFSALHRFERNLERANLQKEKTLSVRTQGISFRGSNIEKDIDTDKPLSPDFSAKDKVKLWHSLTKRGSGNGDVAALSYIYNQINKEIVEIKKRNGKDNRLRIVIACSDGAPDSSSGVRDLAEQIGELNAVVVGIGLTKTAAAVPIIFNTDFSRGDIAYDIKDLPIIVAKHIVQEAVKLFPKKAKEDVQNIIKSSLDKFKNIK